MEHADALERIEIAAAEPDGLDRLMAGDTADAAAVAGHLAGCPACTAQLVRIRQTASVAREVIRTAPDPALREKTLAFVRANGVARGERAAAGGDAIVAAGAPETAPTAAIPATPAVAAPAADPVDLGAERARRSMTRLRLAVAALAAALVVAVGGGALLYRNASTADETIAHKASEVAILEATNRATLRVTAQPDVRRVQLASADGTGATGELLFSPSSGELVAVASDLVPENPDQEYGCWVEVDGQRTRLGKMYWAGDLWTWAGPVDGLADIPPGATFGVSLGPIGGGPDAQPTLTGKL